MKVTLGLSAQKLMSLASTVTSFWRWVLIVKAWICLRPLSEVHWGKRERGELASGFGLGEENEVI